MPQPFGLSVRDRESSFLLLFALLLVSPGEHRDPPGATEGARGSGYGQGAAVTALWGSSDF